MSAVSVREFSYNPSSIFSRVEKGEPIEVTRHGTVIAIILPGSGGLGRYATLIARGIVRLKSTTTASLNQIPRYSVPDDVSPLDILLGEREADDR